MRNLTASSIRVQQKRMADSRFHSVGTVAINALGLYIRPDISRSLKITIMRRSDPSAKAKKTEAHTTCSIMISIHYSWRR